MASVTVFICDFLQWLSVTAEEDNKPLYNVPLVEQFTHLCGLHRGVNLEHGLVNIITSIVIGSLLYITIVVCPSNLPVLIRCL